MATIGKYGKVVFSEDDLHFIKTNFHLLTNVQIAEHLNVKLTTFRAQAYSMGLKRMEMEYWTEPQVLFLKSNYKRMGDTEIADYFNTHFPKQKKWTKRQIEKKRRYLNLKRSKYILAKIHERNVSKNCFKKGVIKAWDTKGAKPIGSIRNWKKRQYVKTPGGYVLHSRYVWQQHHGEIPKGANIYHRDGNPFNCHIDNLFLVMDSEQGFVNRKPAQERERYLHKMILERYNGKTVTIEGKTTVLRIKKLKDKTAVFYNNKTAVLFESELPKFINKIQRK